MSFFNYQPTLFDPNKPQSFDYAGQQQSLADRQAIARRLMDMQMPQGATRVSRGTALAGILAKALGGYLQGQGMQAQRDLDASDKQASEWLQDQLLNPESKRSELEKMAREQADAASPINDSIYTHKDPTSIGPQLANAFGVGTPGMQPRGLNEPVPAAQEQQREQGISDIFNIDEDALDRSMMANQDAYESTLSKAINQRGQQMQAVLRSGGPRVSALAKAVEAQRAAALEDQRFKERKAWEWENQPHTIGKDQRLVVGGKVVAQGPADQDWKANGQPFNDANGDLVQQFTNSQGQMKLVPVQQNGAPVQTQKTAREAAEKALANTQASKDMNTTSNMIDEVLASDVPEQASTTALSALGRAVSSAMPNRFNDAHKKLETIRSKAGDVVMAALQANGVSPSQLMNTERELALKVASQFQYEPGMSAEAIRNELQRFQASIADLTKQIQARMGATAPAGTGSVSPGGFRFPPRQ